ncbi:arylesterase [Niveibacterium sp. SC-1]|uniref:arylesterase n=1 Tax=Niveibacterium sp. SC-1 TaxID=3135646 RepID=UPI00311FA622
MRRSMRQSIVVLFMLWSGVCHAADILVFGDSLSAGYGLRADQAWPALLQRKLGKEGYKQQVINASVSGETTAGGKTRLPTALAQHKPRVVVIELGANDGLRGLPIKLMTDNLGAMARTAQEAGAKVVIIGMRLPPNYGPSYTEKFQQSFGAVAKTEGASLVPFLLEGFAQKRDLFQADGVHPIAEAQPLIVENVWGVLKPLLKR